MSVFESKRKIGDQHKANAIRELFNIPRHSLTTPDHSLLQKYEGLEDKDFAEFKFKNGETDVGVFWFEYGNVAAKKLEKSGKLEWGKERIYFDIPLDTMEKLRDLIIKLAKIEKIPVAFKYLDIQ